MLELFFVLGTWMFSQATPPAAQPPASPSAIVVDYPRAGSVFPPEIIAPLFQWRDSAGDATIWKIRIEFGEGTKPVELWSPGEKMEIGYVDTSLEGFVPPTLTTEQQAAHCWRPDPKLWEFIKEHSVRRPATAWIAGYARKDAATSVSQGHVSISTSRDPVGAPIFFRDVPLLLPPPQESERGVIKPLPDSALPKIKWQLRDISVPNSKVIMEGLHTCANCHSISRDAKTLGIDVDGPANDKGLYALVPVHKVSSISNDYVVRWSDFSDPDKIAQKRFGFMSQVSPDGRYVVTSIDVPGAHGRRVLDRLYNGFFSFYGFGQVFFPTRGVLAWYDRDNRKLQPLPGADDPEYVQTSAFWSPDGKYLVFSKAKAKDPYSPGQTPAKYANDPNETQMQYDLYRIPFNGGKGGVAERVIGASENGLSNNFPKVSPDGKWIVFVQNKNGLLMRPDSHLYIVPFQGGTARRLNCNLAVMNSWHSFSPNGRWLVFSSKTPSYYTQMYLTHIDENGNDTPAILIEHATAANRAVNIPEFMNLRADNLERIDTPAIDFYKMFDVAVSLNEKKQYGAAVSAWKDALALAPEDPRARNNFGLALMETGQLDDAIAEFRKSLDLRNESSQTENNLGTALAEKGAMEEALVHFRKAVDLNPDNASAQVNLGNALAVKTDQRDEALIHLRKGVDMQPGSPSGQNDLGIVLARLGILDEAATHIQKAVELSPNSADYRYNLGRVFAAKGEFADAQSQFEEAAKLTHQKQPAILQMLAAMYSETGRYADAISTAQRALAVAREQHDDALAASVEANLTRYQAQASGSATKNQ
jgi:Flp pilus assembly protein TadD